MKITDEILLELGFTYNSTNGVFEHHIPPNNDIDAYLVTVIKSDSRGEYWLYWQSQHPGCVVKTIMDMMYNIQTKGFAEGKTFKVKEFRKLLEI